MRPEPQYGVQLSVEDSIPLELPIYPVYGVTPSNKYIPIQVNNDGQLSIGNVSISGPITISDVVIKGVDPDNSNTSQNISVVNLGLGNGFGLRTSLYDGTNKLKINSDGSLNIDIASSGSIPVTIDHSLDSVAIYGTDGSTDRFVKTDANGNLIVNQGGPNAGGVQSWPVSLTGATFTDGDLLVTVNKYSYSEHTRLTRTPASSTPVIILESEDPDLDHGRKNYTLYNDSSSSLLVGFEDALTSTNFSLRIPRYSYFEPPLPQYSKAIYGMWEGPVVGACLATEIY